VPVALLGRVPVRVDPNGPTFSSGDSLTISPHSGKAAKAGTAGMIIGKALEKWSPGGKSTVMVFINLTWYEPDAPEVAVDQDGDAAVANPDGSTTKIVAEKVTAGEGIFENLTSFVLATFKKLIADTAEIVSAFVKDLTVDQLTVSDKTSGQATIIAGKSQLTINNSQIIGTSKVFVTFRDSYAPATNYWISDVAVGESFTVTLDQPVSADSRLDYWIVN